MLDHLIVYVVDGRQVAAETRAEAEWIAEGLANADRTIRDRQNNPTEAS